MTESEFERKIVGLLCSWCPYAGADLAGFSRVHDPPTLRIARVMCSERVDPVFILEAFGSGADGVLLVGDCHYPWENYKSQRRAFMLKRVLEQPGLEPERLRLEWVSASVGDPFEIVVKDMTEEVGNLGPSPLRAGGQFNVKK